MPERPNREDLELRAHKAAEITRTLRELASTDGWKLLMEIFEAAERNYYANLTRTLMRGREVNQRKLDHNRGIFDGVRQLLAQPEKAESALNRALERLSEADDKE